MVEPLYGLLQDGVAVWERFHPASGCSPELLPDADGIRLMCVSRRDIAHIYLNRIRARSSFRLLKVVRDKE